MKWGVIMIKIRYFDSEDCKTNCFELEYYQRQYIPERYFKIGRGQSAQVLFLEDILKNSGLLHSKVSYAPFNVFNYNCSVEGIEFIMYYNSTWDTVHFYVEQEMYTQAVAQKLCHLIEAYSKANKIRVI